MPRGMCTLEHAVGNVESCPGARCPFWVIDRNHSGCVLEKVEHEIESSPSLALHLLDLKRELEQGGASDEVSNARSLFHRLLNDEQNAEA